GEIASRVSVCGGGGDRGRAPSFAYDDGREPGPRRILDDRGDGAALARSVEEVVTVTVPPFDGNEEIATIDFAAVVGDARCRGGQLTSDVPQQAALLERGNNLVEHNPHSSGMLS